MEGPGWPCSHLACFGRAGWKAGLVGVEELCKGEAARGLNLHHCSLRVAGFLVAGVQR